MVQMVYLKTQLVFLTFLLPLLGLANYAGAEIDFDGRAHLKKHEPPAEIEKCVDCHAKKNSQYVLTKNKTVLNHEGVKLKHGRAEIYCGHCHDRNKSNSLRSNSDDQTSFENPSPVCKQCHQDRYREWLHGIHGKRIGGWQKNQEQWHCIDCHSPHDVSFKKMKAVTAPIKPKLEGPPKSFEP